MIDFDEAIGLLAGAVRPLGTERASLAEADGRVLAEPVLAQVNAPPADVSSMDGYAVGRVDAPATLRVIGESFPGAGFAGPVGPGEAVRIFTGAPVPTGTERVVIQENVRREGDRIEIRNQGSDPNIRRSGSDFRVGEMLVAAGTVIGPRSVVAAAAADLNEMILYRRPRLQVIATGDELAEPGTARLDAARIPDSVSIGVKAFARAWGAEIAQGIRLRDDLPSMQTAAGDAFEGADLIVVTGGASVGDRDYARQMFGDTLELIFSKVRIKPGKPVWLGRSTGTLILGLPGNPTSAMVTARLFLAPLIFGLTGRDPLSALAWSRLPLAALLGEAGDRETFSRARLEGGRVALLENQDSGAQRTLVAADLLVRRPAGDRGYGAGDLVDTLPF